MVSLHIGQIQNQKRIIKISMGTQLCLNQQSTAQFNSPPLSKEPEMISIQSQQLGHQESIQQAIPAITYAQRSNQRPSLFQAVEEARQRQLALRKFQNSNISGIRLPVFYVYRYQGYYDGEWKFGYPHGRGKVYYKNGSYFEGQFQHGQISGQDNLFIYPDGSYKRGSFVDGKEQGKGIFVSQNGNFRYEGEWKNNKPHGKGQEIYPDGSIYEGQFVDGLKQDNQGAYRWKNGKIYVGSFKNGYMEGQGKLHLPNGMGEYTGQFSKNLIIGHGRMKTQTGIYEGTFQNGLMEGKGTFKWYDGKIYNGQFYQGKLHGKGRINFPNGQIITGQWHYGQNLKIDQITSRQ